MRFALLVLMASALGLAACTTELTSQIDSGQSPPRESYGYYLPKESYSIVVTYTLVSCPVNVDLKTTTPIITQQVVITPVDQPDFTEHYYITYSSLDSELKNTTFQANLYPNQTIQSVGAVVADQTAPSIGNFTSAALSIAKLVAPAAAGNITCSTDVTAYMNAMAELKKSATAKTERDNDSDVVSRIAPELSFQASALWTPTTLPSSMKFTPSASQLARWFAADQAQLSTFLGAVGDLGSLQDLLTTTVVIGSTATVPATAKPASSAARPIEGIVYRNPIPAVIKACQGRTCSTPGGDLSPGAETFLTVQPVNVPQLGPYIIVPLKNDWFQNNNIGLSFGPNGVPCSIAYGKQGRVYQISQALSGFSSSGGGGSSAGGGSASGGSAGGGGGAGGAGGSGGGGKGGTGGSAGGGSGGASGSTSIVPPTCL